jgi:hypothetical protein
MTKTNTATANAVPTILESATPVVKVREIKPPIIPTPREEVTGRKPIRLTFHVGKDYMRRFAFPSLDGGRSRKTTEVVHLYPLLGEWIGRTIPDGVNPRSHDVDCLKSSVAKQIEQTIVDRPEDFFLANRGTTIIAESLDFDPHTGNVMLTITDPDNQGVADGATTDAVLAKVQTRIARELMEKKDASYPDLIYGPGGDKVQKSRLPDALKHGRIHLEVIVGLKERDSIANLVQGRNTSRQVKGWSMADFRGAFDWLKDVLEAPGGPFTGKVGWEENSGQDVNVLDVLSIITLFHREFDEKEKEGHKEKAPVIAYANKGRIDARLMDEDLLDGYKALSPIIPDMLKLHDAVYSNFEHAYAESFGPRARLGRREGVESRLMDSPYKLPLTGTPSNYVIPSGFIFPLLASFRALVAYRLGKAYWRMEPFEFFRRHGADLVGELMEQADGLGGNPNVTGKRRLVYTALHAKARLCLNDDLEARKKN